ncbi:hypothetical protein GJV06_20300 [Enterobacteriaceae bacterium RIT691]|nr:hypothetical protein [Enterobacteriaceae bacterium RIT691]
MSKVPEGWNAGKVSDFLILQRGFDLTKKQSVNGHIPVYSSSGLAYFHNEMKVRGPGVVTGRKGSVGPVYLIEEDFWPHDTTLWVKDFKSNSVEYVKHFIEALNLERFDEASSVPTLNRNNVHCLSCVFPPLVEQEKINEVIRCWDKAISVTEKLIEKCQQQKKTLMQVTLSGNKRVLGCSSKWLFVKLVDVAKKEQYSFTGGPFGSDLKSSDYTDSGIRILQLQNIGDGFFIDDYKIYTSKEKADELHGCNIFPNDIIISKMGDPVARAAIIPIFSERYLMASDGIRLSVDQSKYDTAFIHYVICHKDFRKKAIEKSTGSTRKRIGLSDLRGIEIYIPSTLKEQQEIARILTAADREIELYQQKLAALKQEKQALMQQLLTGKRRVAL